MREALPLPSSCFIEVSTRCNLQCGICGQTLYSVPKKDMSLEIFNKLEPIFSQTHAVMLYGAGEPFINPNYFEMLKRIKSYGNWVSVITNGTLLDEKACLEVVKEGVDELSVSIDGACAKTFNYIRKGADFDEVIQNVRRLIETKGNLGKNKPRIIINFVVTRLNLQELPDLVRLAHALKVDGVMTIQLIEWDRIKDENLKPPRNGFQYLEQAAKVAGELKIGLEIQPNLAQILRDRQQNRSTSGRPMPISNRYRRRLCSQPWDSLQVDFNGNVRPCCWPSRALGNIGQEDFLTIWNGRQYNEFRRKLRTEHPPDECLRCTAMPWSDPIPQKLDMKKAATGQLDRGWYDEETSPQGRTFRWMGKRATFYIHNEGHRNLRLKLFSNKLCLKPSLPVDILINGELAKTILIKRDKIQEVKIGLRSLPPGLLEVELRAEKTFVPAGSIPGSRDGRELSIALCSARLTR